MPFRPWRASWAGSSRRPTSPSDDGGGLCHAARLAPAGGRSLLGHPREASLRSTRGACPLAERPRRPLPLASAVAVAAVGTRRLPRAAVLRLRPTVREARKDPGASRGALRRGDE